MKPLEFNTLNNMSHADMTENLIQQAKNSIKAMQVEVPQVDIPSHVVLPAFKNKQENEYVIAVNGEQKGPYTISKLNEMIRCGEINIESYVWRSGMSEWKMIKDCPDILK